MKLEVVEKKDCTILRIKIFGNVAPEELKKLSPPPVNPKKLLILAGRAPIWFYSHLTHRYHPVVAIATYDPRQGCVVIASHSKRYSVGDVLDLKYEELSPDF